MLQQFRDAIRLAASPRWLRTGLAEKLMYAFGLMADTHAETTVQAVKRRLPGAPGVPGDALDLIGRDRKMRRGQAEPDAVYTSRLTQWLDAHATRGGPYALLNQIFNYYVSVRPFVAYLMYETGARFKLDMGLAGAITRLSPVGSFDSDVARWARWWLIYEWPSFVNTEGNWGDITSAWGDGGVWGSTLSVDDVADLRLIPSEWNAEHPIGTIVLLGAGAGLWGVPGGTWGDGERWGSGAVVTVGVP